MSRHRFAAIAVFSLLLLFRGNPASAQTLAGWEHYQPGTIGAVIEEQGSIIRADTVHLPGFVMSGKRFPTLARVTYCGNSRPIGKVRRDVLRWWGLTFYKDTSVVLEFRREYLFREGSQLHWLPVQDTVASFFPRELQPGQQVSLYVSWAGAYHHTRKDITWTFLVNEFQAGAPGPKCEGSVARAGAGASPAG
jgi:hypothetical protein